MRAKNGASSDDLYIAALDELSNKGNHEPLARLFHSAAIPSPRVLMLLGNLLDPKMPAFNVRLVAKRLKNGGWDKYIARKKRQIKICLSIKRKVEAEQITIEEAKFQVASELILSRATVAKEWESGRKLLLPVFDRFWPK